MTVTRYTKSGLTAALCLGLTLMLEGTAMAQTTRRVGEGEPYGSITAALAAAVAGDTILVTTNVLTENNIVISKNITIAGMGMYDTVVQAATTRSNTVSGVPVGRIFTITTKGLNVTFRDLTLRHGYTNATGGAINMAAEGAWNLSLYNCNFTTNDATGNGGAVYGSGSGSGASYTLAVSNCVFRANAAGGNGGAIYSCRTGSTEPEPRTVNIESCTFDGNTAVHGGAFANYFANLMRVTVRNSTFSGNRAAQTGGALKFDFGSNWLYNVTICTNSAASYGGGMRVDGTTYVLIDNTIVANNTAPSGGTAIWRQGGTVIATNSLLRGTVQGATTTGCILNQDPKLLPLADNGGATPTCALESDSPCRGTASSLTALTTDQRGYARDAAPDMGAFEYGAHARLPQGTLLSIR